MASEFTPQKTQVDDMLSLSDITFRGERSHVLSTCADYTPYLVFFTCKINHMFVYGLSRICIASNRHQLDHFSTFNVYIHILKCSPTERYTKTVRDLILVALWLILFSLYSKTKIMSKFYSVLKLKIEYFSSKISDLNSAYFLTQLTVTY